MDNSDFLKIKELKEELERLLDKVNQFSNKIESNRANQENLVSNIQPFVNPQEFREYLKRILMVLKLKTQTVIQYIKRVSNMF